MLSHLASGAFGAMLLAANTGCASTATSWERSSQFGATRNAIVITGEQLHHRGSDLLGMLASRVSNIRIVQTTGCPQIAMRGRKSISGVSDPGVYVDGQRAADTCILGMLNPTDLARVEIYPMGVTSRRGYHMDGAGLILVFTRRADQ